MVTKLREKNIDVVVHIINGLPYESKEDMLNTVKYLNKLDIQGIKIHMLSVLKDTPLQYLYEKEKFHILTKEEYIDITINQLELLRPEIVIHRITGDPKKEDLIEPTWLLKKFCVLNDIDKELLKRDTYQGKKVEN
jgi:radical SAM protein (TIGR01212 family)